MARAIASRVTRYSVPAAATVKVRDKRAASWFDTLVQFAFIFFATLNKGESHKLGRAAVLPNLRVHLDA